MKVMWIWESHRILQSIPRIAALCLKWGFADLSFCDMSILYVNENGASIGVNSNRIPVAFFSKESKKSISGD